MDRSNSCCRNDEVTVVRDFSVNLGGARPYLERNGLIGTARNPRPMITPSLLTVHTEPMVPPYPTPDASLELVLGPAGPATVEWPQTESDEDGEE